MSEMSLIQFSFSALICFLIPVVLVFMFINAYITLNLYVMWIKKLLKYTLIIKCLFSPFLSTDFRPSLLKHSHKALATRFLMNTRIPLSKFSAQVCINN